MPRGFWAGSAHPRALIGAHRCFPDPNPWPRAEPDASPKRTTHAERTACRSHPGRSPFAGAATHADPRHDPDGPRLYPGLHRPDSDPDACPGVDADSVTGPTNPDTNS